MNTIGHTFRLTTFGESHGPAMGGIIDGCPSGCFIDIEEIRQDILRRQGDGIHTTARKEPDEVEILSGILDGHTIGTPLAFIIRNKDQRSNDYDQLLSHYRPGHGDLLLHTKFPNYDLRGGGRSSARETVSWVVAGSIARMILRQRFINNLNIHAKVESIGGQKDYAQILEEAHRNGDTLGGIIRCTISGNRENLALIGEPVFNKLNSRLSAVMMSIPSAMGFEMGAGFQAASLRGSEYVDQYCKEAKEQMPIPATTTNHCGGIQAGISNGMPIEFRVAFHPVTTLPMGTECIDDQGTLEHLAACGRHDSCHVLRTPIIVESLAALTLLDLKLFQI